jgi:pimeloyl-ACP methyl ester carboxylesterase
VSRHAPAATVFFLPGLGFGARASERLAAHLGDALHVVGIDLPGHDGRAAAADASVDALADAVVDEIVARADGGPFLLCGHSMGGKIAAVVAHRILSGSVPVFGLSGMLLLAPSPLTPEPMADERRERMLSWAQDGPLSPEHARAFVAECVAGSLPADVEAEAVGQVTRMSPLAWRRWLEDGSREDLAGAIGELDLPVVVLAGDDDDDLGAAAQATLAPRTFPQARIEELAATGHLLPYERPAEVARALAELWESIAATALPMPREWGRLMGSDRTDPATRGILARRALADEPARPAVALTSAQRDLLRAIVARILPHGDDRFDIAGRIDRDLAAGAGDGWRPPGLPRDADAYALGLDALARVWPGTAAAQDALLAGVVAGRGVADAPWDADTLRRWFEDVRVDVARTWVSHPATSVRLGYDGFATGVTTDDPGFPELRADRRAAWEPEELGRAADDERISA